MTKSNLTGRNLSVNAVYTILSYISYILYYIGLLRKISRDHLIIIFVIFPPKLQFRLENKNFEYDLYFER